MHPAGHRPPQCGRRSPVGARGWATGHRVAAGLGGARKTRLLESAVGRAYGRRCRLAPLPLPGQDAVLPAEVVEALSYLPRAPRLLDDVHRALTAVWAATIRAELAGWTVRPQRPSGSPGQARPCSSGPGRWRRHRHPSTAPAWASPALGPRRTGGPGVPPGGPQLRRRQRHRPGRGLRPARPRKPAQAPGCGPGLRAVAGGWRRPPSVRRPEWPAGEGSAVARLFRLALEALEGLDLPLEHGRSPLPCGLLPRRTSRLPRPGRSWARRWTS